MIAIECFLLATAVLSVHCQSLYRGFTNDERQYILDLHNHLRTKVALGRESGEPAADYMLAMEWDDRLEEKAQQWADRCQAQHSGSESVYRSVAPYKTGENRVSGGKYADFERAIKEGWYDEYKDYYYDSNYCQPGKMCGHYTQVVWQNSTLLGCGWNRCPRRQPVFFCHYGPSGNFYERGQNMPRRPYLRAGRGAQCRKCPMQFGFCMNNALCASSTACQNTDSQCTCPITSCSNGGRLDSANCKCNCLDNWDGPRCDVPCNDTFGWCHLPVNMQGCRWDDLKHAWASGVCRKSCGLCGYMLDKDTGKTNSKGIKTNALIGYPAKPIRGNKPSGDGNCDNKHGSDADCAFWATGGECTANRVWMSINCAKACKTCDVAEGGGSCPNKHNDAECEDWANIGECRNNPDWMRANCARSCNACRGRSGTFGRCRNYFASTVKCNKWAARGECSKGWVYENCAKSCKSC